MEFLDPHEVKVSSTGGPVARAQAIDLRSVWTHEQRGFSRWLVDNIDFLNEHLPFDVNPESVGAEAQAGDFWVDIVGEATSPDTGDTFKVVIENQLEETDHRHLGQVLTYIAAYGAQAAIWISARARPEHAKAVQWLNDESSIDAWLFDLQVIRIDDSRPAPILRQIIGPSLLSRRAKAERQASTADRQQQLAFWSAALPKVAKACAPLGVWQGRTPSANVHAWHSVPGSHATIGWQMWVTAHGSWICLRVDGDTQQEAQHYFDVLHDNANEIEADFGETLIWQAKPNERSRLIRWNNPHPGGYRDESSAWDEPTSVLAQAMYRLVKATRDHVTALPKYVAVELQADIEGDVAVVANLTT